MSTPDWLVIARREFLERVRTVWFVVVTLLGPIGMVAIVVLPVWLSVKSIKEERTIQVVDRTGENLLEPLIQSSQLLRLGFVYEDVSKPAPPGLEELRRRIRDEEIDGFLELPADTLKSRIVKYRGVNASSNIVVRQLQLSVDYAVRMSLLKRRLDTSYADPELAELLRPVELETLQDMGVSEATSGQATFFIGYAVMFILYMAILLYAVNVLRSVIQEKTSRVVEIMVSAVKPRSLMLGKILGVGGVGLFQLSIWAAIALLLIRFREQVLGVFGIDNAGAIDIPSIGAISMVLVLGYFLLGYFFYAAIYAAIGATVNSEQEAQQAQTPVVLLLIVPVVCVQIVASDPRGTVAEILTLIPFSSPVLMPMRYLLGGAEAGDVALSLAILIASTAGAVWLAARIYRVGILMYGKRPGFREIARWVRHG